MGGGPSLIYGSMTLEAWDQFEKASATARSVSTGAAPAQRKTPGGCPPGFRIVLRRP
jgi:hypothetical protein